MATSQHHLHIEGCVHPSSGLSCCLAVLLLLLLLLQVWREFMEARGLDTSPVVFNRNAVDLWRLFKLVVARGGSEAVTVSKHWARIGRSASSLRCAALLSCSVLLLLPRWVPATGATQDVQELRSARGDGLVSIRCRQPHSPTPPPSPPRPPPRAGLASPPQPP